MKVLVTYFSQSGNTEKIAKAIWEEASQANEADLKKLEDVGAEDFAGYDFILNSCREPLGYNQIKRI